MHQRKQDWEWLRDFARKGDQASFVALMRRHLDLVYATALRKLQDPDAAEEVVQNVFAALARKAWQFSPDDSLPAWLHRAALLETNAWLRQELRRRRREQTAVELGTTMKNPDQEAGGRALIPLLDEGLLFLREKDRTVLLLRYYESRSLHEVGAALGVGEDAARKRVGAALEALAGFFQRRGFQTASASAAAAALAHTAAAAPAALAGALTQSALQAAPPALAGLTALLSRLAALTNLQRVALCLALALAPAGWQWHQAQEVRVEAAAAQQALEAARQQEAQLESTLGRLRFDSQQLALSLAGAEQTRLGQAAAAAKVREFNRRIAGLLTAADYRWPDDLPFIRIPKADLKELLPGGAIAHGGKIEDWGAELLGLTPSEKQQVEAALRGYGDALGQAAAERAYPTNFLPYNLASVAADKPHLSVWVPPADGGDPSVGNDLVVSVAKILGEPRAQLLLGELFKSSFAQWAGSYGDAQNGTLFTVCVDSSNPAGLECGQYQDGDGGHSPSPSTNEVSLVFIPDALARRFFDPWLEKSHITNLTTRAEP